MMSPIGALVPAALVGAAGFEPATWSTQNSRATRLRYAPPDAAATICPASITRFAKAQQAAGGFAERVGLSVPETMGAPPGRPVRGQVCERCRRRPRARRAP